MGWLKKFAFGVMGAAGGLLLYCGSFYVKCYVENRQVYKKYETIKEDCLDIKESDGNAEKSDREKNSKKNETVSAEKPEESFGISWKKLSEINPDVVAWITIPGADISYPVVRGEDDEYYLHHSIAGERDDFGSIFLGSVNRKDFLDSHSFVYGHNMEGNMMFANLNCYENPEFLQTCPEFYIITPKRKFCYEIFSVEQAEEGSMSFRYGYKRGSDEYREQLKILKERSLYDTGIMPDSGKNMVTLVTCNSGLEEHVRMAVHGICKKVQRE